MKKTISINISNIIFHIEEDGYTLLKDYLLSINRYFSSYEDSAEIISDIENRIAEIFLARLGENKQVITVEDVQDLIATMGSVSDFEAAEFNSDASFRRTEEPLQDKHESQTNQQASHKRSTRRLYRDLKRKLIGGVASGIAHYLSIDPLWIRLALMATLVDVFYFTSLSGVALISYLVLWALVPGSDNLPDDTSYKRLFRNPEDRVLGGVASGLAAYFGVDVLVIRLLFVGGIFLGGVGIITYLIFWAITPEAKTLTDKMQMEGEPVTLSNIERKIKEGLNIDPEQKEEHWLVKILLFPFRLLSLTITSFSRVIQPFAGFLGQLLRVAMGIVATIIAAVGIIAMVVFFSLLIGISHTDIAIGSVPLQVFSNSIPKIGIFAFFITLMIPIVALGIAGLSLLAKRRVVGSVAVWSLFGIWMFGIALTSAIIPSIWQQWQAEETLRTEQVFTAVSTPLILGLNPTAVHQFDIVELTLRGYEGNEVKLIRMARARGSNAQNALENARMVRYNATQQANLIQFDKGYGLDAHAVFRGQHVHLELLIPYEQEFIIHPNLVHILRNTLYPNGYDIGDLDPNHRWKFTEEGLQCLNCPNKNKAAHVISPNAKHYSNYSDFTKIALEGHYYVEIKPSKQFEIVVDGDSEDAIAQVAIRQEGNQLKIISKITEEEPPRTHIVVRLPSLTALSAKGAGEVHVAEFKTQSFDLSLEGEIACKAKISAQHIKTLLNGHSSLQLSGTTDTFMIHAEQRADCDAFGLKANEVIAKANDNSHVKVYANKKIMMDAAEQAEISYKGSPQVVQSYRD
ncbi:MAG: PspC domain-containing protein [Cytophagales bacterium]|nr:PspC domain-containing protein [Bernardetiaceae bacterium]MDW8204620.1 PspC domain-containing protein [Cytophagales bacterium]